RKKKLKKVVEGYLVGNVLKIGIVLGRFNEFITSKLLGGAEDALRRHGVVDENMTVVWVPGAFEIPLATKKLADKGEFDAIITLGTVIRGSTPHFDYVCSEAAKGISKVGMDYNIPVIF